MSIAIVCTFYGVHESDIRPRITKALYDKKDSSHKSRTRHHFRKSRSNAALISERTNIPVNSEDLDADLLT